MSPLPGGSLELPDGAEEHDLRDGAEELDLPGGAEALLAKLQKAVKNASPAMVGDGYKRHYQYKGLSECAKFSKMVIGHKAKHILEVLLPSAGLKPKCEGKTKLPVILGFHAGLKVPDDSVGMAVLITAPVNIEINSTSMTKDHFWQTGKILILKPETSIKRIDRGKNYDASVEFKEKDGGKTGTIGESAKEIIRVFYTAIEVEKNDEHHH
ncbi:uncharacterized protein FPRO_14803 [Fusarium proliferatum ET1]|uniref:Uncharacterized protein n=1 Tax=Fusarium proliferatum (strain ET1) TaxID=1227346 RepID=A0A1L7WAR8_FUSPR|nr:uncharacterized protein FPRO_14803 [Fusarium proliferatum ET1]CZR49719.1 uncharacterized protein FPRO_14803 [Fusarium proliferatum ET1]